MIMIKLSYMYYNNILGWIQITLTMSYFTPESLAQMWKQDWEQAKQKIIRKALDPAVQRLWKEEAASPAAEKKYEVEVLKAIKEKRRQKAIMGVDPATWGEDLAERIQQITLTDRQVQKYMRYGVPFAELVHQIRIIFRQFEWPSWEVAVEAWQKVVNKYLKAAKDRYLSYIAQGRSKDEAIRMAIEEIRPMIERELRDFASRVGAAVQITGTVQTATATAGGGRY